jgi:hypothetical protein
MHDLNVGPWWLWALVLNLALALVVILGQLPELRDPDSRWRGAAMRWGMLLVIAVAGVIVAAAVKVVDLIERELEAQAERDRLEDLEAFDASVRQTRSRWPVPDDAERPS